MPGLTNGIVWSSRILTSTRHNISGRLFSTDDGEATSLVGGCGQGGTADTSCVRQGFANFTMRLRDAAPLSPVWLIVAADTNPVRCGPCSIVPDPFRGFVFSAGSTDASGRASATAPLPVLNFQFYLQWIVSTGSGSCLGLDLSNALEVTTSQL